ncbi:MAG: indolepyruvate ferredoxin oxidoreductase [Deltaproteobacteria bacterium]|nr:indolepyruvate ferredoxin oxidoreductase [Deltaproteobacteria bacterium]
MKPLILLGDEAVAQAAIDAGIAGAFAYPGTPSTEIFEYVERHKPSDRSIFTQWSSNEKVAYETALGMSYAGKRAIVSMKHVGLNVAMDAFMNSAITGVNGGMVLIVADDPGMHSSQNEQDSRFLADFARIPCLEPSTQQEAYDMTRAGLALSEQVGLPVMVRIVTRLAHSRAAVVPGPRLEQSERPLPTDKQRYTLLPSNARRHWSQLLGRWEQVERGLWAVEGNALALRGEPLGVIATGIAFNYLMENLGDAPEASTLKISCWPPPMDLVRQLFDHCEEILVLEDGYPLLEGGLKGLLNSAPRPVHGRLDGALPRTGELDPAKVRAALGLPARPAAIPAPLPLAGRPPALCPGCPHIDSYNVLNEVMAEAGGGRVLSDIGCYTLGALAPFEAIDTCVDMGASIGMALGASKAGVSPAVAVIGDSTFAHSGLTGLLDAIRAEAAITVVLLDNAIVAMTGQQDTALAGERLIATLTGLGVGPEHIRVVKPLRSRHEENLAIFREELAYQGVSVIIPSRPCIQIRN